MLGYVIWINMHPSERVPRTKIQKAKQCLLLLLPFLPFLSCFPLHSRICVLFFALFDGNIKFRTVNFLLGQRLSTQYLLPVLCATFCSCWCFYDISFQAFWKPRKNQILELVSWLCWKVNNIRNWKKVGKNTFAYKNIQGR